MIGLKDILVLLDSVGIKTEKITEKSIITDVFNDNEFEFTIFMIDIEKKFLISITSDDYQFNKNYNIEDLIECVNNKLKG